MEGPRDGGTDTYTFVKIVVFVNKRSFFSFSLAIEHGLVSKVVIYYSSSVAYVTHFETFGGLKKKKEKKKEKRTNGCGQDNFFEMKFTSVMKLQREARDYVSKN